MNYGKELIIDLHRCNTVLFTRRFITRYFKELCGLIKMERGDLHFWDYYEDPAEYERAPAHLKGTSAVQFIMTSNITLHALDTYGEVYINIFSCKEFDVDAAVAFSESFFCGERQTEPKMIFRGSRSRR